MKAYIHGTKRREQGRLNKLNTLTNRSFIQYLGDGIDSSHVCDFGCGMGNLINDLAKEYPNMQITGLEISPDQYKAAVKNNKENHNVRLLRTDALDSQLPDNAYDISYCRYVLEHVTDPVGLLREMRRVTKPGGSIICQENDLHNSIFYPEIPDYDIVSRAFCDLQLRLGGDPYIGRKLFTLFKNAGIADITLDIEPEIFHENNPDAYRIWVQNALDILTGAADRLVSLGYVEKNMLDEVCQQMQQRIENPVGVSLFHWNRATGKK